MKTHLDNFFYSILSSLFGYLSILINSATVLSVVIMISLFGWLNLVNFDIVVIDYVIFSVQFMLSLLYISSIYFFVLGLFNQAKINMSISDEYMALLFGFNVLSIDFCYIYKLNLTLYTAIISSVLFFVLLMACWMIKAKLKAKAKTKS